MKSTITLTFGDVAENHVRMEKIGKIADYGFSCEDLENGYSSFKEKGYECELIDLCQVLPEKYRKHSEAKDAMILIVRNGVKALIGEEYTVEQLRKEQETLDVDTKAFMYGRVCNKKARYNLCFADYSQEPKYEEGKGRVINFADIPITSKIREKLPHLMGDKCKDLMAEGNYYYDISKCGIGFHGDAERRIVVGVRIGESMPLHYRWYLYSKCVSNPVELILNDGDIYFMSDKATGNDWKRKKILTLRHAAGAAKFLEL